MDMPYNTLPVRRNPSADLFFCVIARGRGGRQSNDWVCIKHFVFNKNKIKMPNTYAKPNKQMDQSENSAEIHNNKHVWVYVCLFVWAAELSTAWGGTLTFTCSTILRIRNVAHFKGNSRSLPLAAAAAWNHLLLSSSFGVRFYYLMNAKCPGHNKPLPPPPPTAPIGQLTCEFTRTRRM